MSVWLELVGREAAMLVIVAAAGFGPAAYLPSRFGRSARGALAPVLGLCVCVCLFTTVELFVRGGAVAWLVPVVCVTSLTAGLARRRSIHRACERRRKEADDGTRASRRHGGALVSVLQALLVCLAVALPVTSVLASHQSVGPMSYEVFDGPGYVANAAAAEVLSIHEASALKAPYGSHDNYVDRWWIEDAASASRLDYAPFVAAVDALLGLDATATYAPDLLGVLVAGALGMYGSILFATRRRTWFAALGGMVFGGSFFMQLVFDGSQAAITGLVVLVPVAVVTAGALAQPTRSSLAVSALTVAGLATLYPIFLFPLAAAGAAFGLGALVRQRHIPAARLARTAAVVLGRVGVVVGLAGLFDVVASVRDARSLTSIVAGGGIISSFPAYHLGAGVVAGWLLQTRDLYSVAFGPQSPLFDLVPGLLVPLAVVLAAVPGLRRKPVAWFLLLFVAISCAIGAYEATRNHCGYCEDRSLLSAVPPVIFLVFTGLGSAVACGRRFPRGAVVAVALGFLGFVGYDAASARGRFSSGSYYVTSSLRSVVGRIPPGAGPVQIEGFAAEPQAMAAEPYVYELVLEHAGAVSAATGQERSGLAEDWGPLPLTSPIFRPEYKYVLTRLPAIRTGRLRIASAGPVALERRSRPVDVTVEAGLGLTTAQASNPDVRGVLWFVLAGPQRGPDVVRARFGLVKRFPLHAAAGTRLVERGSVLIACIQAQGGATVRTASVTFPADARLRLESMRTAPGRCWPVMKPGP